MQFLWSKKHHQKCIFRSEIKYNPHLINRLIYKHKTHYLNYQLLSCIEKKYVSILLNVKNRMFLLVWHKYIWVYYTFLTDGYRKQA